MSDDSPAPTAAASTAKGIAEDAKEKSPQMIIATAIALLSDFITTGDQAKELKIAAPVIALIVVVVVTRLTDLSIFLFKHFTTSKPEAEIPLDVRLKKYIKQAVRERFWMRKSNPEYAEQTVHIRGLRKRLRRYQLGKLDVTVTGSKRNEPPASKATAEDEAT